MKHLRSHSLPIAMRTRLYRLRGVGVLFTLLVIVGIGYWLLFLRSDLVSALNDTVQNWTFDGGTAPDYSYDADLITVDADGAHPISGVNKFTNPSFTSNTSSWTMEAIVPTGWVEVPGDANYSTTGNFLAMKYEAKCADVGDPSTGLTSPANSTFQTYNDTTTSCTAGNNRQVVSVPSGYPITRITQSDAATRCSTVSVNGSAAHLMTNNEWMTIARNLEVRDENWTTGTVGSGMMFRGHSDNSIDAALVASSDDSQGYLGTSDSSISNPEQKRTMVLSNGAVIWDMGGNAWERLADSAQRQYQPIAWDGVTNYANVFGWSEFSSGVTTRFIRTFKAGPLEYDDVAPSDSSYNSNQGVGSVFHYSLSGDSNTTVYSYLRGGRWSSGINAGIFTLGLDIQPNTTSLNISFRCTTDSLGLAQNHSATEGRSSSGGSIVAVGTITEATISQSVNLNDTVNDYDFSVYVYNNTSGEEGSVIDENADVAELSINGSAITTIYEATEDVGWYKLSGTAPASDTQQDYGLLVKTGKTVIVDDFTLAKQGVYQIYTTSAYSNSNVQSWDTFCEGTLSGATCTGDSTQPGNSEIVYQLCTEDGSDCETNSTWQYWNGAAWATASNTTTHVNTPAELTNSVMQALSIASQKLSVKAIMIFEGEDSPELPNISLGLSADVDAPGITLTPLTPDPTTDSTPVLSGTASDTSGTVDSVEFQVDSTAGSWTACTATDGLFDEASEAFSCEIVSALTDGSHTIYVRATDNSSNVTGSGNYASDSFTVDTNAPTISISPLSTDPTTDVTPTFSGSTTDATGSIASVEFQIDSTAGTWSNCSANDGNFNSGTESFSCTPSSDLSQGTHTIYVRSTDNAGNVTGSGNYASKTFTVNTAISFSVVLDSPGNKSYTNSERPTFKWKVTSNDSVTIDRYKLSIDNPSAGENQPSGDFTIDSIPASRTSDYVTDRYIAQYENFDDNDANNNYISLYTRSSNVWSTDSNSGENDGKLREGRVRWSVTATDTNGTAVTAGNNVFVDRTAPRTELTQINATRYNSLPLSTTDTTPQIFGLILDPLSGTDPGAQDDQGPRVASGPKEVEIKLEKQGIVNYELHTLATIHLDKAWYRCNNQAVDDNSWQKCDKYLPFEFQINDRLELGTYRITFVGKDHAGNSADSSAYSLIVTTFTIPELTSISSPTPEPEIDSEPDDVSAVLLPSPLPSLSESLPSIQPSEREVLADVATPRSSRILTQIKGFLSRLSSAVNNRLLAINLALLRGYRQLVAFSPTPVENVFSQQGNNWWNGNAILRRYIATTAFSVGKRTQGVSDEFGHAIVNVGYQFVSEPTRITNVKVEVLSSTSAIISWETNHPANSKVNYGLDETYGMDQQSDELVEHHEFTLTNLQPETQYHFEVMSHNKNYVYDANRKFTTLPVQ
jgi:hypothetical protein